LVIAGSGISFGSNRHPKRARTSRYISAKLAIWVQPGSIHARSAMTPAKTTTVMLTSAKTLSAIPVKPLQELAELRRTVEPR